MTVFHTRLEYTPFEECNVINSSRNFYDVVNLKLVLKYLIDPAANQTLFIAPSCAEYYYHYFFLRNANYLLCN